MDPANILLCSVCDKPSTTQCSRCQYTKYCDKECQKPDWRKHKPICDNINKQREEFKCSKWLEYANKKVLGNILIMASHRCIVHNTETANEPINGTVFVSIDETKKQFMNPGSLHFAHLSFSIEPNEFAHQKYDIDLQNVAKHNKVPVDNQISTVYILKDFVHIVQNSLPEDLESLKNKSPYTEDDWSVLFEL